MKEGMVCKTPDSHFIAPIKIAENAANNTAAPGRRIAIMYTDNRQTIIFNKVFMTNRLCISDNSFFLQK